MLLDCDGYVIISLLKPVMFSSQSDPVRIDAEWTDIQPAIDHITIFMQRLPETWGENLSGKVEGELNGVVWFEWR